MGVALAWHKDFDGFRVYGKVKGFPWGHGVNEPQHLGIGVWDLGQVRKQGCHWYGLYVHIVRNNATEDCSDQQPCFCLNDTKLRIFSFDGKSLFPLREGDYSVKSLFAKDVPELEVSMHRRPNQSPPK